MATGLDPDRYRALVALPEDGELSEDLRAAGIEVLVRPLAVLRRSIMSPAGLSRVVAAWAADAGGLGRLARARGVALVHTNTSVTLGGSAAARVASIPHVWHVREIYTGFDRWWPAYRRLLTTADALPCVSRATRDQFGGLGRATVLHDGLAVVPRRADRAASRAALGLPPDATVLAVLGRVSGWKGQDVAVRALGDAALRDRSDVVLAIAGDPWRGEERHLREVHELAAGLGLRDRVRHVGFQDDVDVVYGAADVVLVPSKQPDPFPNAALEAAGAGCCVVASDHGGLPEMLADGRTAVLVPPDDPAALAAAVAGLVDDPARRERLGAAAAADIAERFSTARMLERIQALYDVLLSA
ncbi:glycosyltransferase family 4 protein [Paraconexibacter antarcticus]|uniref:Glycosyltransferase family 4 protein n=1 Tax=Paraconexibacter antarcticus TaxID=2949664 RepID=A0ABY5DYG6_9ACTN|nr:glycosyltransferase family 4 protein [Paraconexibacter antarcticus]